jgi:hypothetical protein
MDEKKRQNASEAEYEARYDAIIKAITFICSPVRDS